MTRKGTGSPKTSLKPPAKPKTGKEDPAFYEALGRAIKVARTELGVERRELAERANVSYAYLSDIETGRGRPGSRSLLAIAEALGRSVGDLLHEAELYRQRMTSEVEEMSATPSARRWFHEQPPSAPEVLAAAAPPPGATPTTRELRSAWKERLSESDAQARAELHAIIDRLSREDLDVALTLARRLAGPERDR